MGKEEEERCKEEGGRWASESTCAQRGCSEGVAAMARERIGRALRMLIHETRGIVDFFVDDEVEVLFSNTKKNPPNQPNSFRVCDPNNSIILRPAPTASVISH